MDSGSESSGKSIGHLELVTAQPGACCFDTLCDWLPSELYLLPAGTAAASSSRALTDSESSESSESSEELEPSKPGFGPNVQSAVQSRHLLDGLQVLRDLSRQMIWEFWMAPAAR